MRKNAPYLLATCLLLLACGGETDLDGGDTDSGTVDAGDAGPRAEIDAGRRDAGAVDAGGEPDCAAVDGARCYYVAPDGDDAAAGTIEAPFQTFHAALALVGPGDFIYARGGTYGLVNSTVSGYQRLPRDAFPTPCPPELVETSGTCQVEVRAFASIRRWSGWPAPDQAAAAFDIPAGEPGRPITLRNFPGEVPVLDTGALFERGDAIEAAIRSAENQYQQRVAIKMNRSHWVVRGFEITGGSIDSRGNIQDLTIEDCDIHDLSIHGGDNPGLIRINRGPEDVRIINNRLYNLFDLAQPGEWENVSDAQHFGAVTTLSGENYGGDDGTGAIEIRGNTIFNVPQAFFFKNQAAGPITIESNHIYDCGRLAGNVSSNVTLRRNLIHGVRYGFWRQGQGYVEASLPPDEEAAVFAIDGHNLTIEYNTIVGLEDSLVGLNHGDGHVFRRNVIVGLTGTAASAGYDSASYIKIEERSPAGVIMSDENCFVVADAGFQMVAVYPSDGPVQHFDLAQARSMFSLDLSSSVVVETDLAEIFVDVSGDDYALRPSLACGAAGHAAP